MHNLCSKHLKETDLRMGKYYNYVRKELPSYSIGSNLVILNGKYIRTPWAEKKLDAKLFRLFKVTKLVGPEGQSVQLELPSL